MERGPPGAPEQSRRAASHLHGPHVRLPVRAGLTLKGLLSPDRVGWDMKLVLHVMLLHLRIVCHSSPKSPHPGD